MLILEKQRDKQNSNKSYPHKDILKKTQRNLYSRGGDSGRGRFPCSMGGFTSWKKLILVVSRRVIKYKLNMAEASFYMNDEEELEYYDSSNNNDWFEECHGKGNHIVMPHYTAEVPEMFSFRSPVPEPAKPDLLASEPTGPGYHEELNTLCNSLEPLSSQIEFSSTEQEDHQLKPEEQEEEFFPQIYTEPELITPVFEQARIDRSILQISMDAFSKRTAAEKGKRFETKNLCKHVHTETMRHLKKRDAIHQFAGEEREQVKLFCHAKASIDNFKDLFRNLKIALLCREFYESPYFIREILASKMEMGSKLTIIKYLEKMRILTHDPDFKAWKKENN